MSITYSKLDNPAWFALSETHADFSISSGKAKRYRAEIVSFAAQESGTVELTPDLKSLLGKNDSVFVIGELPVQSNEFVMETVLPCAQMISFSPVKIKSLVTIEQLHEENDGELNTLVNFVQPGYFNKETRLMGDYFGIRQDGKLVAVTGERMRMFGLTEVSAVVTHPDYTGRGFAQQLVAHVVNKNLDSGVIPFLHVSESNQRAIGIYEMLGFVKRRTINFTKIIKHK